LTTGSVLPLDRISGFLFIFPGLLLHIPQPGTYEIEKPNLHVPHTGRDNDHRIGPLARRLDYRHEYTHFHLFFIWKLHTSEYFVVPGERGVLWSFAGRCTRQAGPRQSPPLRIALRAHAKSNE
jgi:hypothetical protein